MKLFFATTCSMITGAALGIGIYYHQTLDTEKKQSQHAPPMTNFPAHYSQQPLQNTTPHASSSQLEAKLAELIKQQNAMHLQQAEINREMNAIQFRLDTHSASFRPIQMEQDTPPSEQTTPLLPPLQ